MEFYLDAMLRVSWTVVDYMLEMMYVLDTNNEKNKIEALEILRKEAKYKFSDEERYENGIFI
jgi:hypothetical protein